MIRRRHLAVSIQIIFNTPSPRAGPHRPLLPRKGVRTWGTHKVYPSPIPSDSPCHHGSIPPTITQSESFWNAQFSYFSLLPGHCGAAAAAAPGSDLEELPDQALVMDEEDLEEALEAAALDELEEELE